MFEVVFEKVSEPYTVIRFRIAYFKVNKLTLLRPFTDLQAMNFGVRIRLAKEPGVSANILLALSKDRDNLVRAAVARNPNTPANALVELSKDRNWCVRNAVVRNRNTPMTVLEFFSKSQDYWEIRNAAINIIALNRDYDVSQAAKLTARCAKRDMK